jgi:hypothetical protein
VSRPVLKTRLFKTGAVAALTCALATASAATAAASVPVMMRPLNPLPTDLSGQPAATLPASVGTQGSRTLLSVGLAVAGAAGTIGGSAAAGSTQSGSADPAASAATSSSPSSAPGSSSGSSSWASSGSSSWSSSWGTRTLFGFTLPRPYSVEVHKFRAYPSVVHEFAAGLPSRIHVTGMPVIYSFDRMPSDAQFRAWLNSLNPRQHVWWAYDHEIDWKIKHHKQTLGTWRRQMAHLMAIAKGRPNLAPALILTGWEFATNGGRHFYPPTAFWIPGMRAIGGDMDGLDTHSRPYPNFTRQLDGLLATAARVGHAQVLIPEFGAPTTTWDPSTRGKAEWMRQWAERFCKAGVTAVAYFDTGGEVLNRPDEIHSWGQIMSHM